MRIRCAAVALATVIGCTFAVSTAHGAWLPNGSPLVPGWGDTWGPRVSVDDQGSSIVAWNSQRSVMVQKLATTGERTLGWPSAALAIDASVPYTVHGDYELVAMSSDGQGGAYLAVLEQGPFCGNSCGESPVQLYLHHITAAGTFAPNWGAQGVRLQTRWLDRVFLIERTLALVPDGQGGVFLAWSELGELRRAWSIRTQHVSADGRQLWPAEGVLLRTAKSVSVPALQGDDRGGAFVFWSATDSTAPGSNLEGQHVSAQGVMLWSVGETHLGGRELTGAEAPVALPGRGHSAIVVSVAQWRGTRGLYAIQVRADGRLGWREPAAISRTLAPIADVKAVASADGSVIATWPDARIAPDVGIFAQKLSTNGRLEWPAGGVALATVSGTRTQLALASDAGGGAFLSWGDPRLEGEIYGARLTRSGQFAAGWQANGTLICRRFLGLDGSQNANSLESMSIVPGPNGTAVLAWNDFRLFPPTNYGGNQNFAMLLTPTGPAASAVPMPALSQSIGSGRESADFGIRGIHPNPASLDRTVRFSLPDSRPAILDLLDVQGRRLWSRDVGALGAGSHDVRLADRMWLPAGTYFARLTQGERSATSRLVIVR